MRFGLLLASHCFSKNGNSHNQYLKDEKVACPLGYVLSVMLQFHTFKPSECSMDILSGGSSLL